VLNTGMNDSVDSREPLAARMRPRTLAEFVGQEHLIGPGKPLRRAIESDRIGSMLFWGPPGSGKTTLAAIISKMTGSDFINFSAVLSGVKEVRAAVERAEKRRAFDGGRTILFVDEIHRFNRAQQDAFLPHVESGTLVLIGATTENPSFEVNSALLSRLSVWMLHALSEDDLVTLMKRALADAEQGLGEWKIHSPDESLRLIAALGNGDARRVLMILEAAADDLRHRAEPDRTLTAGLVRDIVQRKTELYDKSGEEHYNLISALHKSLRGSDAQAALYWLYRMLEGGEDPLYIARRLVRFASEDIGLADPRALTVCIAARDAYHFLGTPEGELALAEATIYLACAPKSNAVYRAEGQVRRVIAENPSLPVPMVIRNAVTRLMKDTGYGKGYLYPHDSDEAIVAQDYLPDAIRGQAFYRPTDRGEERALGERLSRWEKMKAEMREKPAATDPP
jgi:putative ATPase